MNFYLFFKALHLIAIISWMAGLLYLPRIFVYHAETKNDDFKVTKEAYSGPGKIINSEFLNGLSVPNESIAKTIEILEKKNLGKKKLTLD